MSSNENPELTALKAEVSSLKAEAAFQERLRELQKEVDRQAHVVASWKWIAGTIVAVAAFLGYSEFKDIETRLRDQLREAGEAVRKSASNLGLGFTYTDSGRYEEAIPYLLAAYKENPRDEAVLVSLIYCIDELDAWANQRPLTDAILHEPETLKKWVRDPRTFNSLGLAAFARAPQDKEAQDLAIKLFTLSNDRFDDRNPDRRFPLYNLGRVYFSRDPADMNRAQAFLAAAKPLWTEEGQPLDFEGACTQPWFRAIEKNRPNAKAQLKTIWPASEEPTQPK